MIRESFDACGRHLGRAEHRRDRRAEHVGVEQADLRAVALQREREVDRDRRLADAALAGRDRDDVLGALEHGLVARRRLNAVLTSAITVTRFAPRAFSAVSMRDCSSLRSVSGYACVGMSRRTSTSSPWISKFRRMR